MDLQSQEAILRLAQANDPTSLLVLLGAPDPEAAEISAETVILGDPAYAGALAGAQLGLEVYHVLDDAVKAEVPEDVWEEQIGLMADVLDADALVAAVRRHAPRRLLSRPVAPSAPSHRADPVAPSHRRTVSSSATCRDSLGGVRWLVDGMNVIGSRPDGWWRDRAGAARRLTAELQRLAGPSGDSVSVAFEGGEFPGLPPGVHENVLVLYARRRGPNAADDRIVEELSADADPGSVTVVTSDRDLARRVREEARGGGRRP